MSYSKWTPYLFLAPALILFLAFTIYPIFASFVLSFQTLDAGSYIFVGLDNYIRLLNDTVFGKAILNTIIILVVQVPIMLFLALVLANALNNQLLKLRGFFRVGFFLPAVTSLVAYSILFSIMLQDAGIINQFLGFFGIGPISWLSSSFWAKASIILAMTWRWTGYNMIFYLSALQNVDKSIYEAAEIDGATAIQKFFKITVPMLKPIILFTSITSTIGTLQIFDEVMNITKGGPGNATLSISQYIYNLSFEYTPDFGYAATVSYVIVVIIVLLSLIQFKVAGDN